MQRNATKRTTATRTRTRSRTRSTDDPQKIFTLYSIHWCTLFGSNYVFPSYRLCKTVSGGEIITEHAGVQSFRGLPLFLFGIGSVGFSRGFDGLCFSSFGINVGTFWVFGQIFYVRAGLDPINCRSIFSQVSKCKWLLNFQNAFWPLFGSVFQDFIPPPMM